MKPPKALPAAGSMGAWILAARPKTLVASLAPVIVGSGIAFAVDGFVMVRAAAAFVVAVGIQIGTNLVNDGIDHRRGADTSERLGPPRAVALGLLSFRSALAGGLVCFGIAGVVGLWLASVSSWWVLLPGGISLVAGVVYTAGPAPLAYLGLGEVFVFGFFGLFATVGTTFVQADAIPAAAWFAGAALGFLSIGILEVNNIRDVPTDEPVGKRTLAVRLGSTRARRMYAAVIVLAFVCGVAVAAWWIGALLVLIAIVWAVPPVRRVLGGTEGRALNLALIETARLELVFGILLAIGIAVSL